MELRYKIEILRGGAAWGELKAVDAPSVDASMDAEIHMSMAGEFAPTEGMDLLTDRLRYSLIIDGEPQTVGIFCPATAVRKTTETGAVHLRIEAYDLCYLVKSTRAERGLHFSAGEGYLSAVRSLLLEAGLPLILAEENAQVLATDREWGAGTDYLSIVNELLEEINYRRLWINPEGWAVLEPDTPPSAAAIRHRYGPGQAAIRLEASVERDAWDVPNVFVLVCDNPDLPGPLSAAAENNNPISELSILRRGRRIAQVYKVRNVASQAELQAMADRMAYESVMRSEIATVETAPEGGHGIGDVVAADHPLAGGIWRETGWSLRPGSRMRHTWERMILI